MLSVGGITARMTSGVNTAPIAAPLCRMLLPNERSLRVRISCVVMRAARPMACFKEPQGDPAREEAEVGLIRGVVTARAPASSSPHPAPVPGLRGRNAREGPRHQDRGI